MMMMMMMGRLKTFEGAAGRKVTAVISERDLADWTCEGYASHNPVGKESFEKELRRFMLLLRRPEDPFEEFLREARLLARRSCLASSAR
mmetsp:Transcript_94259/g.155899  ORF Transcript_94259/g.155899 Transcript_94259/m.155899 type:complete len:89 (+) Transcript_94259:1-267(+)